MSGRTAIEHLVEYPISVREIKELPLDHQACLSVLCHAVSEANALSRTYISTMDAKSPDSAIEIAINIQRFTILRSWSGRLFEAVGFLETLVGQKPKSKDRLVQNLATEALENFNSLRSGRGYKLARNVRNEAAFHYGFDAARKNMTNVSDRANFNLYLHEMNGNSFYPMVRK